MQYINSCISKVLEQWGGGSQELYFQQSIIKTESPNRNQNSSDMRGFKRHT